MLLSSDTKGDSISLEKQDNAYKKSGLFGELHYSIMYFPSVRRGIADIHCKHPGFRYKITLDIEQSGQEITIDTKPLEREAFRRGYIVKGLDSLQKIIRDAIVSNAGVGQFEGRSEGNPRQLSSSGEGSTDLYLREIKENKIDVSRRFS